MTALRPPHTGSVPRNQILLGDALTTLKALPPDSIDCVVTSPPYAMLRNYGMAGQLGLEPTVDAYVDSLVAAMHEVRRVLKSTGTIWLNLGDSYSRHARFGAAPKSLVLAPERVALRLVQDGFVLRNKVIWSKPNPMPTSARDRLSTTWEYVYVFAISPNYHFDLDAIRVPHQSTRRGLTTTPNMSDAVDRTGKYESADRSWAGPLAGRNDGLARLRREGRTGHHLGKNPGDVWRIPTGGYRGAHFATFPPKLIETPIRAGCPVRVCTTCGAPWSQSRLAPTKPSCACPNRTFTTGLVLDPFMGAGTTAVVAHQLGRDYLGIELNPEYRTLALQRIASTAARAGAERGGGAQHQGDHHHEPPLREAA